MYDIILAYWLGLKNDMGDDDDDTGDKLYTGDKLDAGDKLDTGNKLDAGDDPDESFLCLKVFPRITHTC